MRESNYEIKNRRLVDNTLNEKVSVKVLVRRTYKTLKGLTYYNTIDISGSANSSGTVTFYCNSLKYRKQKYRDLYMQTSINQQYQ